MLSRVAVCLVGTSNPENLGAVARLLENFGVERLRLVAPRARLDDPRALVVGRTAQERLTGATVTGRLDEAVASSSVVIGFSARRGRQRRTVPLGLLPGWLERHAPTGEVALVFGREDTGLHADDVERCDLLVTIETPGALASLNVAQSVAIALYTIGTQRRDTPVADAPAPAEGATRTQLDWLVDQALAVLERSGLGDGPAASDTLRRARLFRQLLLRAAPTAPELRELGGLVTRLLEALPSRAGGTPLGTPLPVDAEIE